MLRRRRRNAKADYTSDLVHVIFPLQVGEDGWPPVGSERMWASVAGKELFRLENAPWFVFGVAEGDVVRARARRGDEWPEFVEVVERSGNCTIRISPLKEGPLAGDQGRVLEAFEPLGVTGERAGIYPIVALTVTPDLDLAAVKALVQQGEAEGWWAYEEGSITPAWRAAQ